LSEYDGWKESDISFLLDIPFVEGVDILSRNVTDVTPIPQLKGIRMLGLACRARTPIDLSDLRHLKSVFLTWRNAYGSIFALDTMARINIIDYPGPDLTGWKKNDGLRELRICSRRLERLTGVRPFRGLQSLDLFRCRKLCSLSEIAGSTTLRK